MLRIVHLRFAYWHAPHARALPWASFVSSSTWGAGEKRNNPRLGQSGGCNSGFDRPTISSQFASLYTERIASALYNNAYRFEQIGGDRVNRSRSSRPVWLGEDARGWDHGRVHFTLSYDRRVSPFHLAVYFGLVMHAELRTGDCRPAADTLAKYASCGRRKVVSCLDDLRSWGYIEIHANPGHASSYRVLPPPELADEHDVRRESPTTETVSDIPRCACGAHLNPGDPCTTCMTSHAPHAHEQEPLNESRDNPVVPKGTQKELSTEVQRWPERLSRDEALQAPCPECPAEVLQQCMGTSGRTRQRPHVRRGVVAESVVLEHLSNSTARSLIAKPSENSCSICDGIRWLQSTESPDHLVRCPCARVSELVS